MHRGFVLFVALWSVQLAPMLCMAGVLKHPCHHHEEPDCSHESRCENDPCAPLVQRHERPARQFDVQNPVASFLWAPVQLRPQVRHATDPASSPINWQGRPYPPGSLPLLI